MPLGDESRRRKLLNVSRTAVHFIHLVAGSAVEVVMMAKVCGLEPGEFVHTLGDAHLYLNHLDQARLQLTREPMPLPTMDVADKDDLFAFQFEDFKLEGYQAHQAIAAPIAV